MKDKISLFEAKRSLPLVSDIATSIAEHSPAMKKSYYDNKAYVVASDDGEPIKVNKGVLVFMNCETIDKSIYGEHCIYRYMLLSV
tara:strand:+ start:193 stop:447 length:255 start_codon:yes stop_codon:yes gene_type:complete